MSSRSLEVWIVLGMLALPGLPATAADAAPVPANVAQAASKTALGDLSGFRAIAVDTLKIVQAGDFSAAKKRIKDLELRWDEAEPKIKPLAPKDWQTVDIAIDRALKEVRAWRATQESSGRALRELMSTIDAVK